MTAIIQLLEKTLPVFIMLGLGMLCRSHHLLSREGVKALKNVAISIALPAVMFSAFAEAQYTPQSILVPLMIFILCILMLYAGKALCRLLKIPGRLSPFLSSGFEAGMLGYSLFSLLFPGEPVSGFAMIDLGQVLFVFTVYKILLAHRNSAKEVLKEAASSTTVWAILAGLLFGATGLYQALQPSGISGVIDAAADFIAAPTSSLILLSIGYDLSPTQIHWKKVSVLLALRLGVASVALVVALLADLFLLGGLMHQRAALLMFILPPPFVLPVFADVEEERSDVSSALSALTLISIILFAVLAAVL